MPVGVPVAFPAPGARATFAVSVPGPASAALAVTTIGVLVDAANEVLFEQVATAVPVPLPGAPPGQTTLSTLPPMSVMTEL